MPYLEASDILCQIDWCKHGLQFEPVQIGCTVIFVHAVKDVLAKRGRKIVQVLHLGSGKALPWCTINLWVIPGINLLHKPNLPSGKIGSGKQLHVDPGGAFDR
jgi:hypothetical protein